MKVYGLYYGSNLSAPTVEDDLEEFASSKEAKDTFWRRSDFDPQYPCVERSEMALFAYDPRERSDNYPSYLLTIGPRGGVRVERC